MSPERHEEIGLKVYDFERKYQDKLIEKQGYPESESLIKSEAIEILRFMQKGGIAFRIALDSLIFIDKMAKQTKIPLGELQEYLIKEDDEADQEHRLANEEL